MYFISRKNEKHTDISQNTYDTMIDEFEKKYCVKDEVDLDELEEFEVRELKSIYKVIYYSKCISKLL